MKTRIYKNQYGWSHQVKGTNENKEEVKGYFKYKFKKGFEPPVNDAEFEFFARDYQGFEHPIFPTLYVKDGKEYWTMMIMPSQNESATPIEIADKYERAEDDLPF